MGLIDWLVLGTFATALFAGIVYIKRFTTSVADFLAANRSAGRYLVTIAEGASGVGAITLIAQFEVYHKAGFVPAFWTLMMLPVGLIISLSGWVIYRYRQTRAMTLAQFLEMRYSRRFRIFAGLLAFSAGIINYGIFPAVSARFFIYFAGLPPSFILLGLEVSTFAAVMLVLLGSALYFTLNGGQVAIMITDFLQGQLVNIALLCVLFFAVVAVDWSAVAETLLQAPEHASKVNPFKTSQVKDFNVWYYLIAIFGSFYGTMAWQGSQAYNASAKSPHEARMAKVLSQWRLSVTSLLPLMLPICALVVLSHPSFAEMGAVVQGQLDAIENPQVRNQLITPLVVKALLPAGLLGLFAVVMLSAALSTDNTYLHSWGSIFIQDVVLPWRGRPLTPKQHMLALRLAIVGVAVFAFCFSFFFRQTQYILLFFAITGTIFLGGAGSVIIGGLYWKRGTTAGAWASMLTGSTLGVSGIIIKQVNPGFFLNGQQMFFIAMVSSATVYIVVSLLGRKTYDLDRLLHRGRYAEPGAPLPAVGIRAIMAGPEFSRRDKFVFYFTMGWSLVFFGIFLGVTLYNTLVEVSDQWWLGFWKIFIAVGLLKGIGVTIWFCIGGAQNLRELISTLRSARRDLTDDGSVRPGGGDQIETSSVEPNQMTITPTAEPRVPVAGGKS
jgi:solute:Na+ symporter, SSS family